MRKKKNFWVDHYYCPVYRFNLYIYIFESGSWNKVRKRIKKKLGLSAGEGEPQGRAIVEGNTYVIALRKDDLSLGTIVHEVAHIRQFVFERKGLYDDRVNFVPEALKEAEAYFEESIFNQVIYRAEKHISWGTKYKTKTKLL